VVLVRAIRGFSPGLGYLAGAVSVIVILIVIVIVLSTGI